MLQPGAVLPRGYVVERVLGQGGMGAVYLARQTQLGRSVAVKETVLQLADPREQALAREQFHKEAEILASLEHPGLVDVKDYFEEGDAQYLVMAFIDGETLESVVNRTPGFVPVAQAIDWICQVCDVLSYLHSHDPPVLCRDVKPANIMLGANGRVRLIDFGIARFCLPQQETVAILKGAGTIGFAPPEQFAGTPTDASSDIYSLGATLYSLLTRQVPPWSVALATGAEPLHAPSAFNPAVTRDLDTVVMTMMALRKDRRYQVAATVKSALMALGAQAPPSLPSATPLATSRRFCARCGATIVPMAPHCATCGLPTAESSDAANPAGEPAPSGSGMVTSPAPPASASPAPPHACGPGGWPPAAGLAQMPPTGAPPAPPPTPASGGWPAQMPPTGPPPVPPPVPQRPQPPSPQRIPPTMSPPAYPPQTSSPGYASPGPALGYPAQSPQPGPPLGYPAQSPPAGPPYGYPAQGPQPGLPGYPAQGPQPGLQGYPGPVPPFGIPAGFAQPPSPRKPLPVAWVGVALAIVACLGIGLVVASKKPSPSASASPAAATAAPSVLAGPTSPAASITPAALTPSDLGVETLTMTREMATEMGIKYIPGARIMTVAPGGPADRAHLQRNDVIQWIGRHPIFQSDDVTTILAKRRRGETLAICFTRNGDAQWRRVQVPLAR